MKKHLFEIIMSSVFVFLCCASIYFIYFPLQRSDIITLDMKLAATPRIQQVPAGKRINLSFHKLNQFEFYLDEEFYSDLSNQQAFKHLHKGSLVTIAMDREEYYAKIAKSIPPRYLQSHFNWKLIQLLELKVNNQSLLSLQQVIEMQTNTAYYFLIFGACGIICTFFLLYFDSKVFDEKLTILKS
jgi:hypothetical protein